MIKERIQEVFDFTKSESPYSKANKGWINQDIFLDLSPSADKVNQTNEAAKITLLWSPINSLLSNIFLIFILGSILVFCSVSFAKGRFDFNLFNNAESTDVLKVEENKSLNINLLEDLDSNKLTTNQNIATIELDKVNKINSSDDDLIKPAQENINKKIEKQEVSIDEKEINKDIKSLQNKKTKSNFI